MDREPSRTQQRNIARRLARQRKADATRMERIVRYLRAFGAFSLVAAGITLMLLPEAFPYFVSFVYGAVLLWTADAVFELREYGRYRFLPIAVALIVLFLVSTQFVLVRLPLMDRAWSTAGAYEPSTVVGGIEWLSTFNDIHVTVDNNSDYDYSQLDLLIKPKEAVVAAAMLSTFPNASITRELSPMSYFDLQLWHQATGTRTDIPTDWFASTGGFRIHCDSLPRHSRIEVLMAIASVNQKMIEAHADYMADLRWTDKKSGKITGHLWFKWQKVPLTDALFDPRPNPSVVEITGQYTAFDRRKQVRESLSVSEPMINAVSPINKLKHK